MGYPALVISVSDAGAQASDEIVQLLDDLHRFSGKPGPFKTQLLCHQQRIACYCKNGRPRDLYEASIVSVMCYCLLAIVSYRVSRPSYLASSVIFLLHIALDIPVAIQGLWSPLSLPFMQLNNTAVVFIKVRVIKVSKEACIQRPCSLMIVVRCACRWYVCSRIFGIWTARCVTYNELFRSQETEFAFCRVLAWQTRSGHWLLYIPRHMFDHPVQCPPLYPPLLWAGCRSVRFWVIRAIFIEP